MPDISYHAGIRPSLLYVLRNAVSSSYEPLHASSIVHVHVHVLHDVHVKCQVPLAECMVYYLKAYMNNI